MNARERLIAAINHCTPDRAPVDLGSTTATGMAVSTMANFRDYLGLKKRPIKAFEPFQMLGEVDEDLREIVGSDCVGLWSRSTWFGYKNINYKKWTMPDGLEVLVGEGFQVDYDKDGGVLLYPQGDRAALPSAKMPKTGKFFDILVRQEKYSEDDLDGRRDYKDSFHLIPDDELNYLSQQAKMLYENTTYGIVGHLPGAGLGSPAHVPGPAEKKTPGIRKIDEWYMAHYVFPEYIHEVFELQTDVALKNLQRYYSAVGNRIQVIWISGTDFGTQRGELMSSDMWCEFYKPYYKKINDWVHQHTTWKTFYHTCGSIVNLIEDMIDSGFDILNPVQCSAAGMDPRMLKKCFGDRLTFWGGAIDTQKTLPFGRPDEVFRQATERLEIFSEGGGYIYTPIHNVVANVPPENLKAFYNAYKSFYGLPLIR